MTTNELLGDYATTDQRISEQDEIANHIFCFVAQREGRSLDEIKSGTWRQRCSVGDPGRRCDVIPAIKICSADQAR
jgi:hypothetical protein